MYTTPLQTENAGSQDAFPTTTGEISVQISRYVYFLICWTGHTCWQPRRLVTWVTIKEVERRRTVEFLKREMHHQQVVECYQHVVKYNCHRNGCPRNDFDIYLTWFITKTNHDFYPSLFFRLLERLTHRKTNKTNVPWKFQLVGSDVYIS